MAIRHNPRCAIFREPPGLRDAVDCNCGAIPPLNADSRVAELEARVATLTEERDAFERANETSMKLADELAGDVEAAEREAATLREALADLVRLKDGPRDDAYRAEKDAAWKRARAALAGTRRLGLRGKRRDE